MFAAQARSGGSMVRRGALIGGAAVVMTLPLVVPASAAWFAGTSGPDQQVGSAALTALTGVTAERGETGQVDLTWDAPDLRSDLDPVYTLTRTIDDAGPTPLADPGAADGAVDDLTIPAGPGTAALTGLTVGAFHSCARDREDQAYCWGSANAGRLGNGQTGPDEPAPVAVTQPPGVTFTQITAGFQLGCALDSQGAAWCWGSAWTGALGNGENAGTRTTPVAVTMPPDVTFTQIASATGHACALDDDGVAWCWGSASGGQLGNGESSGVRSTPVSVSMPADTTFVQITTGSVHTCAIDQRADAWCWGLRTAVGAGDGATSGVQATPVRVAVPAGTTLTRITAGGAHACALQQGGAVWCWGANHAGQLGHGLTTSTTIPTLVQRPAGITFTRLAAGGNHTCAIDGAGDAWCWGRSFEGLLGGGSVSENQRVPRAVLMPAGVTFTEIGAGHEHTCALSDSAAAWCWGGAAAGQLGNAETAPNRFEPVPVSPGEIVAEPCPARWTVTEDGRCAPGPDVSVTYTVSYALRGWVSPTVTTAAAWPTSP